VQAEAFLWLAERRRKRDRALALADTAMACRGDFKELNKRIRKMFAE
jgi:hypothetical protein